jgi:hypothetical protein
MKAKLFILIFMLIPSVIYADEYINDDMDVRITTLDAKKFLCFDQPSANKLLQMRIDIPKLKLQIDKTVELVGIKDAEIIKLLEGSELRRQQLGEYEIEVVRLTEELNSARAWYLNPWMWGVIGVVLGAGATIGIYYGASK